MTSAVDSKVWAQLTQHFNDIKDQPIHFFKRQASDPFLLRCHNMLFDYSKNKLNRKTINLLLQLANEQQLADKIQALFNGDNVNTTEQQPALHTALRRPVNLPLKVNGQNVMSEIANVRQAQRDFCEQLASGKLFGASNQSIDTLVHIGVGGSDLGPRLLMDALTEYHQHSLQCHFVDSVDDTALAEVLKQCQPHKTLFIIASKSFTTYETLTNAMTARQWLVQRGITKPSEGDQHFVAVTAAYERAAAWGVRQIFPLWSWVGGRYSIWSSVSLCAQAVLGSDHFEQFLQGAFAADQHFQTTPFAENIPVVHGLIAIWMINFFNIHSTVILPYGHGLKRLPTYLQQLEMESNGKPAMQRTAPACWGVSGSNNQHAVMQCLLQGSERVLCDFILLAKTPIRYQDNSQWLMANGLNQAHALWYGASHPSIDSKLPGGRGSQTWLLPRLDPYHLGALLAFYEHKVYVQASIWNINPFDQWGVELCKRTITPLLEQLKSRQYDQRDPATALLLEHYYATVD